MNLKKKLLFAAGFIFLLLGAIGVFFPVLPTTPFVLLAAGCFSSNEKILGWLKRSKFFGEYITNYNARKGLSKETVVKSLVFLWAMMIISIIHIQALWSSILLPCIGAAVTVHILLMARPKAESEPQAGFKIDDGPDGQK